MTGLEIALGFILLVMAAFLMVAVVLQSGKDKKSGVISGGAETFFGKNKAKGLEAKLALITKICAIVFVVLAIINLFLN